MYGLNPLKYFPVPDDSSWIINIQYTVQFIHTFYKHEMRLIFNFIDTLTETMKL